MLRAQFPNPQGQIFPEQFVSANVYGAVRPHAIFVPQQSVMQSAKGAYVFVIDAQNKAAIPALSGLHSHLRAL